MATPVVLTTGARPIVPVESGGVPMTPVDTLGEPVTVVDTLGEPVVLINNDGTPAFLAYSAKTYLGGVAPYHWLDFINNRALYAGADVGNVTQATGYSFTRASDGYYTNSDGTLTNFASGALRRGDRGVLVEGARTNLILRSQEFDDAAWAKSNTIVTADAIAAPDGTTTADTIAASTAGDYRYTHQALTLTNGTTYTLTAYFKFKTATYVWLLGETSGDVFGLFNISNGTLGATSAGVTTSITAVASGWYRCSMTFTVSSATALQQIGFGVADSNNPIVPPAAAGTDAYIWGAQLEAASFPSSYIPTVAAAATRAADVLTYTVNTTAQINAAVAGQPELVTNGTFDTDSDWTKGADWTISGGSANKVPGTQNSLTQTLTGITSGNYYALTFDITVSGATVVLFFTSSTIATISTSGTYTYIVRDSGASDVLAFQGQVGTTASIDNISVKEIPAGALTLYPLSLFAEFVRVVDTGGTETIVSISDGSENNQTRLIVASNDDLSTTIVAGGADQGGSTVSGSLAINSAHKAAVRVATNDFRACSNGTLGGLDLTVTLPSPPSTFRIALRQNGAQPLFGYLRTAAIIPRALTDTELEAITS